MSPKRPPSPSAGARRRTAQAPMIMVNMRPGNADWPGFCDWVRRLLYHDAATSLVRYRPRDAAAFSWAGAAEAARIAASYNAANAGRAMPVQRAASFGPHIRLDGLAVAWSSVRLALGIDHLPDGNVDLPAYRDCSDAELVATYGLDFALQRLAMIAANQQAKDEIREAAIERLALTMGRRLTAVERAIVAKPRTQITAAELRAFAAERQESATPPDLSEALAKLHKR